MIPRDSERVSIRRVRSDDLVAFQSYRADPDVGALQGWQPQTDALAGAFLDAMADIPFHENATWFQLGIAERTTDQLIGDIGVVMHTQPVRHAEIGFSLSKPAQGRGFAFEAIASITEVLINGLGLAYVLAITDERNAAARKLLARLGFRHVDTVVAVFRDAPCNEFHFELTSADIRGQRPG